MKPLVSIVIPIYNVEKYIRQTIQSVQNQTYKKIEIICVDDGSTDSTVEILRELGANDSRIKIIEQENQFAGVARNNGKSQATGDYIMFLDSDDIFEKNMVSFLVKKAQSEDPDIIVFGYWLFIDSVRKRRPTKNIYKNGMICSAKDIQDSIFQQTRPVPWDKFIKKSFLDSICLDYQNTKVNNDVLFNRIIVTEAKKISFCGKRFVNYRISNNDSLQGKLNKYPIEFIKADICTYEELIRRGTFELFKSSYQQRVIDDIIVHLQRIKTYEEFEMIVHGLQEYKLFNVADVTPQCIFVRNSAYRDTLEEVMYGNVKEALAMLHKDCMTTMVQKSTLAYRIGNKLLALLHMTYN